MANVPTVEWDEDEPTGARQISEGDNRIRELKTQIRQVIDVDHDFPSSGYAADVGQHKQVTLQEAADIGTGAEGVPILGAQTASGKAELTFTDEDDNDVQMTSGGNIRAESIDGVYPCSTTAKAVNILSKVYPVGCIYTEITGTNPNTTFGFGTWTAFGAGKVLVGLDSGDADFDTVEETGGAKTHTHEEGSLVIDKDQACGNQTWGTKGRPAASYDTGDMQAPQIAADLEVTGTTASGSSVQPYIVVHMWKRTA